MAERWRILRCEEHGIQLGPKDTLRCGAPVFIQHLGEERPCELMLEIIEVEEVRWPYGEPPPAALDVLVEAEAKRLERGIGPFNEASQQSLRSMIRPSAASDLEAVLSALRASWTDRAQEAKGYVATALGQLRAGDTARLERNLAAALDRLYRILDGETYIEGYEALREQTDGAYHFTAPAEDLLPLDRQLRRFVSAQEKTYEAALAEIRAGEKEEHWMWFIFPQVAGLGSSEKSRYYAIHSLREARAYMGHKLLGPRLVECASELIALKDKTAADIFSSVDVKKLQSSMTLFVLAAPDEEDVFQMVLDIYFDGKRDERTVAFLDRTSVH